MSVATRDFVSSCCLDTKLSYGFCKTLHGNIVVVVEAPKIKLNYFLNSFSTHDLSWQFSYIKIYESISQYIETLSLEGSSAHDMDMMALLE